MGLALAYTQVPGGPSSPNLSAGSSIARQAVWLDRRLMAAGCWGTSGANGGVGFPPSGVWEFPSLVWFSVDSIHPFGPCCFTLTAALLGGPVS